MLKNKIKIIAFLVLILFSTCKKKEKNSGEVPNESIPNITILLNTQNGAAIKYKEIFLATKDSLEALISMGKWLIEQPDVSEAYIFDDRIVEVHFKSGLKSHIKVVEVDANGKHFTRGVSGIKISESQRLSESQFGLKRSSLTGLDGNHIIGNKKVLVFIPFYKEFYGSNYDLLPRFEGGAQKLDVTVLTDRNADLEAINSFADYGFIIINSHGLINGFVIRPKVDILRIPANPDGYVFTDDIVRSMFTKENNLPLDKIENGELVLDLEIIRNYDGTVVLRDYHVLVTDNYIRNIPDLKDAVVFGNHCYSGYTADGTNKNNMSEAFKSRGAISYYGYAFADGKSDIVSNEFARIMEDSLITSLVINGDSTGIAHLKNNFIDQYQTIATRSRSLVFKIKPDMTKASYKQERPQVTDNLYFKHFFDDRYKYGCGDILTDERDLQKYKTVCIGKQVWMAQNLNYAAPGSYCYDNDPANCNIYGKLYEWKTLMGNDSSSNKTPSGVKGICPKAWHVPSDNEWKTLINFVGGYKVAGGKLKSKTLWDSPNVGASDSFLFAAIAGGYGSTKGTFFSTKGIYAYFWSSTESSTDYAYIRDIMNKYASTAFSAGTGFKEYGLSCRCVKD